jgi:glycosyltransferase involved in cell wall biosynthesis
MRDCLASIRMQDYSNYEVVITDNSNQSGIYELVREFSKYMSIDYSCNTGNRTKWTSNLNRGINIASTKNFEVCKILFQDDFFIIPNALSLIVNSFKLTDTNWSVCGSTHVYDTAIDFLHGTGVRTDIHFFKSMVPEYSDRLTFLENTISSPSVLAVRNGVYNRFDNKMILGADCEFYVQMYKLYGNPFIISETLICNRTSENSVTAELLQNKVKGRLPGGRKIRTHKDLHVYEVDYLQRKHKMIKRNIRNEFRLLRENVAQYAFAKFYRS